MDGNKQYKTKVKGYHVQFCENDFFTSGNDLSVLTVSQ